ncbi:MAG: NACHT domain-containing protein [Caldilineaceae bacterium]|nr:NACHT domain-containing protein [Caldilineaceae bacterium]
MLRIHLLGQFRLTMNEQIYLIAGLPKSKLLLAYLLLNRAAPSQRDQVAFTLWPEVSEQEARANLRRHLYDLQKMLPEPVAELPWLARTSKTIQWNPRAAYWLDVAVFESLDGSPEQLAEAVGLYGGELLATEDEEWLSYERGRLRALFLRKLQELVHAYQERGEYDRALIFVQQALADDPLDEEMVRTYMWLRYSTGDRTAALQAYRQFCEQLKRELDLPPMPETEELAAQISGQVLPVSPSTPASSEVIRPTTSSAPAPSNLPATMRRIIGRTEDLQALLALFQSTKNPVRLVTLTGAGGIGKTRLATEVANALHQQQPALFGDGIYFLSLASVLDRDLILPTIAHLLGIHLGAGIPVLDGLIDALRYKRLLLVLDNFEHLLAAAEDLAALLAAVPGLHLLVTSQALLNLYGERAYSISPLSLPAPSADLSAANLLEIPAVVLFCEVAQSVNAQFQLSEANASAVVEICRRLDGMPLAIELAAAWIKLLSPARILEQLSARLDFLTTRLRNIPERHRSLRAAIEWSFNLLGEEERRIFTRLAIFSDSFTPNAISAVLYGHSASATTVHYALLDCLTSLVEKNIIYQIQPTTEEETRFAMLSTLREYAWERLQEDPELRLLQERYVHYYAKMIAEETAQWNESRQKEKLQRLLLEENNVRAALAYGLTEDTPLPLLEESAQLVAGLSVFWESAARFDEAIEWLNQIVHRRAALKPETRVRILNSAGRFYHYSSEHREKTAEIHEEALRAAYALENVHLLLDTLDGYAISANESGNFEQAAALWTKAIQIARSEASTGRLGHLLNNAATSYTLMGRYAQAMSLLEESLTIARASSGSDRVFSALVNLSNAARLDGQTALDRAYLQEASHLAEKVSSRITLIVFLSAAAERALYTEDYVMSALLHQALQAICQQINMAWPARYQQEFAGYMIKTKAHLDEGLFNRLVNQGARLTLDQAIERVAIWLEER